MAHFINIQALAKHSFDFFFPHLSLSLMHSVCVCAFCGIHFMYARMLVSQILISRVLQMIYARLLSPAW